MVLIIEQMGEKADGLAHDLPHDGFAVRVD
jgi:hypothetical protein